MAYQIYKTCETCGGDGVAQLTGEPYGSVPCWHCGGSGQKLVGNIADLQDHIADVLSRCNDILDKCNDILEKLS